MPNIYDPFCPLPEMNIFNNLNNKESFLEKIFEKINVFSNRRNMNSNKMGSSITAAIYAAYDSVRNITNRGSTRILLFSSNKASSGIVSPDDIDFQKYYSSENEIKLFMPFVEYL
jgi:hypothetical protein